MDFSIFSTKVCEKTNYQIGTVSNLLLGAQIDLRTQPRFLP